MHFVVCFFFYTCIQLNHTIHLFRSASTPSKKVLVNSKVKTNNSNIFGSTSQNQFSSQKTVLVKATIPNFELTKVNYALNFVFWLLQLIIFLYHLSSILISFCCIPNHPLFVLHKLNHFPSKFLFCISLMNQT